MSDTPRPVPPIRAATDPGAEYFSQAFHASPAMLMIGRLPDGVFLEINDAFLRASGFSREEVVGRTAVDLNIWKDVAGRTELFTRLQRDGQVRDFEAVFYTKQRELRYVLLNANLLQHGGQRCMLLTAFDLSERRRREQLQQGTFEISRILLTGGDYRTMFAEVQRILGTLMSARNFFVAMQSETNGLISFPYHSDEKTPPPSARPPGNGLTEHVLRTGTPLLATRDDSRPCSAIPAPARRLPTPPPSSGWQCRC
jgi:PAS domain S-box-containing protein